MIPMPTEAEFNEALNAAMVDQLNQLDLPENRKDITWIRLPDINPDGHPCEMIPTVTPETEDEPIDWYRMWAGSQAPSAPAPVLEKKPEPLPTFLPKQRVYKHDGTFEEK